MSNIGHVKYNKLWRSSSVFGARGGYGTVSLTNEYLQISQVCIIIYILINETLFSDFSIWASTNLTLANENSQTIEDLTVNDKCLPVSQPVTENQSASKEKINIGTLLLLENWKVHDLCESQLPENRESKEGNEA